MPTWRDSAKFKPFYKSRAWKDVREFVLSRCQGLCEDCLDEGKLTPAEVVHHTIPLNESNYADPDISLNPDRLRALCHDHHTEAHRRLGIGALNGRTEEEPRVRFDVNGNVLKI